jgi:polyhydroxyalkanoate synthase subunit PhaC
LSPIAFWAFSIAASQGHQVFLISWRSAVPETGHLTWDDYLDMGPLKAVCPEHHRTNALGFLRRRHDPELRRGGAAARQQDKLATVTLLTTMLDYSDTGEIGLLIDAGSLALREATIGRAE